MRRSVVLGFALFASLAAQRAEANSCNLYSEQRFGEFREGCSITTFSLPEIDPPLPTIKRNGQELVPTIVQDQITLKVTYEHYVSKDSCDTYFEYENKPFDRYVMTWPDLKGGDEIVVNDSPYVIVVPSPGDCGTVEPFFYCQDGIQFCGDPGGVDPDPDHEDDSDLGGCSVNGSDSASWLAILAVLGFVSCSRRSRASSRR